MCTPEKNGIVRFTVSGLLAPTKAELYRQLRPSNEPWRTVAPTV
jgi:hypothetical protein